MLLQTDNAEIVESAEEVFCNKTFHEVLLLEFKSIRCKNITSTLFALYADTTLSRNNVQKFINNVSKLLEEPLTIFSKSLNSLANTYSFNQSDIKLLNVFILEFRNLFQGLNTEYLRSEEVGNLLGSHSEIHRLGAVYFSIPSISTIYQSKLENIFLAFLFHSSDLKEERKLSFQN